MINKNKPTIPDVLPLIKAYKQLPGNGVGGNLHVYLDDGNTEAGHVLWCLEECIKEQDYLGEGICRISLLMSNTQRHKLSSMFYSKELEV